MDDIILGWLNPGRNSTVLTWHDSAREEWNLQVELSFSIHPGLSLLDEFILDSALVLEKVEKLNFFEKTWCLVMAGTQESLNRVEDVE